RAKVPERWRVPSIEEQDQEDEEAFEEEVDQQAEERAVPSGIDDNEDDEDDDDEDEDEDEDNEDRHRSGPIPVEVQERAFALYRRFLRDMEDLAQGAEKPVKALMRLVGASRVKIPRATNKWSAFQSWIATYGDEKKPDDMSFADWTKVVAKKYKETDPEELESIVEWHKTQYSKSVETSKGDGSFSKTINKTRDSLLQLTDSYVRQASQAYTLHGLHCFGFIVNLDADQYGKTGTA
ncbi:hypothetical protein H0H92_015068, partial [Tricholoma furcatifolium]